MLLAAQYSGAVVRSSYELKAAAAVELYSAIGIFLATSVNDHGVLMYVRLQILAFHFRSVCLNACEKIRRRARISHVI